MIRVFIVFFIIMTVFPLIFLDLSSDRVSVKENRMLAEQPNFADMKNHPVKFIRGFDAWFKDSTGFREPLVDLYNIVQKNKWLNGILYTDGQFSYVIGEEGHHYFTGNGGKFISFFQGKKYFSYEQLLDMAAGLEKIKTYLDGKGIPLVVMFCTSKESIYPEFYPRSIRRGPEPNQLDVITGYLQEHTSVDVFNISQALLAEKDNYLLYPLIDNNSSADFAHYNQIAAFFAYRELMKYITIHFPRMVPYELSDIEISYDELGTPDISLKAEITYNKLDPSFFDDVNLNQRTAWENTAYENTESGLPTILFFRDSYAGWTYANDRKLLEQFIPLHFSKTIMIHYKNMKNIEEYVVKYQPDIVVIEAAEHAINDFAASIPRIQGLP